MHDASSGSQDACREQRIDRATREDRLVLTRLRFTQPIALSEEPTSHGRGKNQPRDENGSQQADTIERLSGHG